MSSVCVVWKMMPGTLCLVFLLFAFRDLWKERGDSNFQFYVELTVTLHADGVVGTLNFTSPSLCECVLTFPLFCKYTLHVCYVSNVIEGLF